MRVIIDVKERGLCELFTLDFPAFTVIGSCLQFEKFVKDKVFCCQFCFLSLQKICKISA